MNGLLYQIIAEFGVGQFGEQTKLISDIELIAGW